MILMLVIIWWFSFFNWATWATRSSKCFCFLILDLLADSRFDIILFLFLWSINACKFSSEPEFWIKDEPEDVPLDEAMRDPQNKHATFTQEQQQRKSYGRTQIATDSKLMQTTVVVMVIYILYINYNIKVRFWAKIMKRNTTSKGKQLRMIELNGSCAWRWNLSYTQKWKSHWELETWISNIKSRKLIIKTTFKKSH